MKKIIFSLCILLLGINAYAKSVSELKVPVMVKNSFYKEYPKAEHVRWEVTKVNDYKANFRSGDDYGSAYYTDKGEFIESDITVQWKDVPLTGRMEIYHLNKRGHITNVLKILNSKHQTFYLVLVKKNIKHYEILLDEEGYMIK